MKKSLITLSAIAFGFAMASAQMAYDPNTGTWGVPQTYATSSITIGQNLGQLANSDAKGVANACSIMTMHTYYGHRHQDVKSLQAKLNAMGARVPVTGYYGKMTKSAVAKYLANCAK